MSIKAILYQCLEVGKNIKRYLNQQIKFEEEVYMEIQN